jgi:hypothetical protein
MCVQRGLVGRSAWEGIVPTYRGGPMV